RISSLTVISEQSMSHYKGTQKTVPEIARELNVDGLVEGSVIRTGDSVRINVRISRASDGRSLWAKSYGGEIYNILTLQGEVALAIMDEVKLTQGQSPRLAPGPPPRRVDPEAYVDYLWGRQEWNKRTAQAFYRSIQYFEQAIAKDSNFALAYAGLADTYALQGASIAAEI